MADTIRIYTGSNLAADFKDGTAMSKPFPLIENYIYFYHTDTLILLPNWPEQIQDGQTANFSGQSILGRSAPIQAYGGGGARTITTTLHFHREMLKQTNLKNPMVNTRVSDFNNDYVEYLTNEMYGAVIPNYSSSAKLVDPPVVAMRFGNQIYIKGVCTNVSVSYGGAILRDNKYSMIDINMSVTEIAPYDAITAMGVGGFRSDGEVFMNTGMDKTTYSVGTPYYGGGIGGDQMIRTTQDYARY